MADELDPGDFANLASDVLLPQLEEVKPATSSKRKGRAKKEQRTEPEQPPIDPFTFHFESIADTEQPKPQEDPEIERAIKQKQLDKIFQYKEKFSKLKSRNKVSGKSTLEELDDEVHYIEEQLGGGTNGPQGGSGLVFVGAMHGMEYVAENVFNPLGLNLTGLGKVCSENVDQFTPLLDELMIKHGMAMAVSVEVRLTVLVATTMMTVHAVNSGNEAVASALSKMNDLQATVNPSTKKKHADL